MNVFITGANRGIGLAFVQHYLARGDQVYACHRDNMGGLADIRDTPALHTLKWDVSKLPDESALQALPDSIDLLINNAGIYGPGKDGQMLEAVTADTMHHVFDINCVAQLRIVQVLLPRLRRPGAVIANMSSKMGSSADNTSGGAYAYRAAKAALVIVSKSMAMDLEGQGIRVITLHPGWVRTDMGGKNGLINSVESVAGMASVIDKIDSYEAGAFVAFDGAVVPY
ncbi:MAG TPA: short-chain dehydrogenase [Gammaproteobacteria bacterium]|nr:short-chain dehydrogenase [Gammaproteobacteria bacterium]